MGGFDRLFVWLKIKEFYYGIAEEYGLELEYLQSILNGLTPVGAANEWDL